MTNLKRKHQIDRLLVLVLLGLFAMCILAVLLTGARTYRALSEREGWEWFDPIRHDARYAAYTERLRALL